MGAGARGRDAPAGHHAPRGHRGQRARHRLSRRAVHDGRDQRTDDRGHVAAECQRLHFDHHAADRNLYPFGGDLFQLRVQHHLQAATGFRCGDAREVDYFLEHIEAGTVYVNRPQGADDAVLLYSCLPPPPPPPGISAVDPDTRGTVTIRQQLARHRADSSCAVCHAKIDPAGFALESFDPIGGLRRQYRSNGNGLEPPEKGRSLWKVNYRLGPVVDCGGELPDGRRFDGPREFTNLLVSDPGMLAKAFVAHLSRYATGSEISYSDRAEIRKIVERAGQGKLGLRTLIHELAESRMLFARNS